MIGISRGLPGPRQSGYVLVEMLVSTAVMCAVLAVLLQLAVTGQHVLRTQSDAADLQQRLRVAVVAMQRDLLLAGAGPTQGAWRGRLVDLFAPVVPARTGARRGDAELSHFSDRISIVYVPDVPAQTSLTRTMASAGAPLGIDPVAAGCPAGGSCGFSPGDRALIFDPARVGGGHDLFTVEGAGAGQLLAPAGAISKAYPAGSPVVQVVQRIYYLDRAGNRLMVYDGESSDVPLVDHVVDLRVAYYADPSPNSVPSPPTGTSTCVFAAGDPPVPLLANLEGLAPKRLAPVHLTDGPVCGHAPNRFDGDLLRVTRIAVTIRLEAEAAELRGSGAAFVRSGTSRDGTLYVADQQVTFEVSPRNMRTVR